MRWRYSFKKASLGIACQYGQLHAYQKYRLTFTIAFSYYFIPSLNLTPHNLQT